MLGNYTGTGTGTCSWQISVSPKVFNADTNKITVFQATTGNVPINCPLICLYRDRLVMAGAELEPHLWYMSRQGDPYDWNYVEDAESTETDYGIAIAGQNSNAGIISQPIRALMPHSDDYLVFGYDSQLWILRGDPVAGGQLDCISRTVGIVGKRAWCYGPSGEIFFMSHNGVHRLEAGGSSLPQMISYSNLPAELCKHTYRENIQMAYDTNALGIHIFIEGQKAGWFFSVENESFWPVLYASGAEVTSLVEYKNGVLMGCKDGFVRTHKDNSVTDDGRPFDSYVVMGPVRLGRDDYGRGVLQKLGVTMCGSMGIGGMDFDFFTADEPIEAAGKYEAGEIAETQSPYRDTSILMSRLSGGCMLLKVGLTAEAQGNRPRWWGMERLGAYIKSTGRFRE